MTEQLIRRWARFSRDRRFRYLLGREWEMVQGDLLSGWDTPAGQGRVVFIMLNPSNADARQDDPTLRRCMGFARAWSFRQLQVVNLFSLVTPDPEDLKCTPDPIGQRTDKWIKQAARGADRIIAAWGAHGHLYGRDVQVRALLRRLGKPVMHLGLTQDGQPRHPLYLPAHTEAQPWQEVNGASGH